MTTQAELDRALDMIGGAARQGKFPSSVAIDALRDQCDAAWTIDDNGTAMLVSVALQLLASAGTLPAGHRAAMLQSASETLAAAAECS